MTDHDDRAALRSRAERGTPRDPGEIFEAALTDSATLAAGPERHERPGLRAARIRTRYAAAAALVVVLGIGGAVWIGSDDDPAEHLATEGSTFCRTMSEPVIGDQHDAIVYLEPETRAADASRLEAALTRLPGLVDLHHVDAEETWAEFQQLFRDDPEMLENVRATDLPTSFELDFEVFDAATESALQDELGRFDTFLDHPEYRTASDVRVLDVVGLAGYVAAEHGAADPDLAIGALISGRLSDLAESDPTLDPQVRTDLGLMQQVLAGGLERRLSDVQVEDVIAAADRLTGRAETSCGLAFEDPSFLPGGTPDSMVATMPTATTATAPPAGN